MIVTEHTLASLLMLLRIRYFPSEFLTEIILVSDRYELHCSRSVFNEDTSLVLAEYFYFIP